VISCIVLNASLINDNKQELHNDNIVYCMDD